MSPLPDETVRTAAIDAFVETIWRERDPWRQARLLTFVRKERYQAFLEGRLMHAGLLEVAETLYECEKDATESERRCYWAALELLTEPSAVLPAEGLLWIEPVSGVCFVRIAPGAFRMGSDSEKAYREEKPVHEVEITREYWLGRYAVTNGEYGRYLGPDPAPDLLPLSWKIPWFNVGSKPVVRVSWEEAELGYCGWLRGRTGLSIHLPTEAEWEYGCRAGTEGEYGFEGGEAELKNYAWYGEGLENEQESPHVVGLKRPNKWGLQDLHGNVCEWCWDRYDDYKKEPQRDPTGPASGLGRVYRGGSWFHDAGICRSAYRLGARPGRRSGPRGFRLALSPVRRPEAW